MNLNVYSLQQRTDESERTACCRSRPPIATALAPLLCLTGDQLKERQHCTEAERELHGEHF